MKKLILLPLGIVAGLAAGAPYYVGTRVEQAFPNYLQAMSDPRAEVKLIAYERGWLHSTARVQSETVIEGTRVEVLMESDINHALWELGGNVARVTTRVNLEGEFGDKQREILGDQPLVSAVTDIDIDGVQRAQFTSPAFTWKDEGVTVEWAGVSGSSTMAADLQSGDFDALVPALTVHESDTVVSANNLSLAGSLRRGPSGGWLVDEKLAVSDVNVSKGETVTARANGLGLSLRTDEADGLYATRTALELAEVQADGQLLRDNRLTLSMERIDAETANRIQESAAKLQGQSPEQVQMQMTGMFMFALPKLLERGPRLTLSDVHSTTPMGDVDLRLDVAYAEGGAFTPDKPAEMIRNLRAEADIALPRALAEQIMRQQLRNQIEAELNVKEALGEERPDPEVIEAQLDLLVEQQVMVLTMQGLVTSDDKGRMLSELRFDGQELLVNGQSMNQMIGLPPKSE